MRLKRHTLSTKRNSSKRKKTTASLLIRSSIASTLLIGPLTLVTLSTTLRAENVAIPHKSQQNSVVKPSKGLSKRNVESRFGAPQSKHGPNGDPAIYYWEYPAYTVYFENNIVIHSVSKTKSLKAH